jgi:hypothetical protein
VARAATLFAAAASGGGGMTRQLQSEEVPLKIKTKLTFSNENLLQRQLSHQPQPSGPQPHHHQKWRPSLPPPRLLLPNSSLAEEHQHKHAI